MKPLDPSQPGQHADTDNTECRAPGAPVHGWWESKIVQHFKGRLFLPHNPAVFSPGIYPDMKPWKYAHTETCTWMFITATEVSFRGWMGKLRHVQTVEIYHCKEQAIQPWEAELKASSCVIVAVCLAVQVRAMRVRTDKQENQQIDTSGCQGLGGEKDELLEHGRFRPVKTFCMMSFSFV